MKNLPREFMGHPAGGAIVAEADIAVTSNPMLRAKLLVFSGPSAITKFWREALSRNLGRGCLGAVTKLQFETLTFRKDGTEHRRVKRDRRYFCIIGLSVKHLSMEIITHESVHAGYAYRERVPSKGWPGSRHMPEEAVCHPARRIAAAINRFLYKQKLYQE